VVAVELRVYRKIGSTTSTNGGLVVDDEGRRRTAEIQRRHGRTVDDRVDDCFAFE